nr:LX [Saccharolobus solfataricus]
MAEVKIFMVRGTAIFSASRFPTSQKYVRALNEKQAIEYIYSQLGGKNKINDTTYTYKRSKKLRKMKSQTRQ